SSPNCLGDIRIMFEKPFRVGHRIKVGGVEGLVEDVGFRSTRLRTRDDSIISIPNNSIVNTTIENRSLRVNRRQRLVLQVTYDTPNEKMMLFARRMKECINEHPLTNKDNFRSFDDSGIAFNDFGESSL